MKRLEDSLIYNRAFDFSLEIISLYRYLSTVEKEYVLSKQLLRSGTSIGANVSEALFAQSRKDFISKLHIALKEAIESIYWIKLLEKSSFISEKDSKNLLKSLYDMSNILKSIILTTKENTP